MWVYDLNWVGSSEEVYVSASPSPLRLGRMESACGAMTAFLRRIYHLTYLTKPVVDLGYDAANWYGLRLAQLRRCGKACTRSDFFGRDGVVCTLPIPTEQVGFSDAVPLQVMDGAMRRAAKPRLA